MSWEMYEAAKKIADGWYSELEATRMRNAVLGRDNAKLRELVRDVHALGWSGFDCTECPRSFRERCIEDGGCPWVSILTDRMRELGVDE